MAIEQQQGTGSGPLRYRDSCRIQHSQRLLNRSLYDQLGCMAPQLSLLPRMAAPSDIQGATTPTLFCELTCIDQHFPLICGD